MESDKFTLPNDPDKKMLVSALLTAATCARAQDGKSLDKAAHDVRRLYMKMLNLAEPASERAGNVWKKLSGE
jgi:hypothetical protein